MLCIVDTPLLWANQPDDGRTAETCSYVYISNSCISLSKTLVSIDGISDDIQTFRGENRLPRYIYLCSFQGRSIYDYFAAAFTSM
jgi:hypothetical protein